MSANILQVWCPIQAQKFSFVIKIFEHFSLSFRMDSQQTSTLPTSDAPLIESTSAMLDTLVIPLTSMTSDVSLCALTSKTSDTPAKGNEVYVVFSHFCHM